MKPLAADDPRVIGEYRLRAQLGAGGMGRVYLGLSPAGRAVAIKVVHPDLASDADFLRRFGQEVAAARAVSGIYTAPVVASGLNERPPWLATAFVPGPPLDQVVGENGPSARAGAVAAAGRAGRGAAGDPRLRRGAPRPQARQRAAGHRRAAGDRLRHRARRRRHLADGGRGGVRHAGLHVAGAGRGPGRGARERRVRARLRGGLRGGGDGTVRHRDGGGHLVPRGARRPGPGRGTAPAPPGDRRLPGQGPGRPPVAARAVRHDRRRAWTPPGRPRWRSGRPRWPG